METEELDNELKIMSVEFNFTGNEATIYYRHNLKNSYIIVPFEYWPINVIDWAVDMAEAKETT